MSWPEFVQLLLGQWRVIAEAWPALLLLNGLIVVVMWRLLDRHYKTRIENCEARIANYQSRIDLLGQQLSELRQKQLVTAGKPSPVVSWRAPSEFIATLKQLANQHTRLDIGFLDPSRYPLARHLASAFETAGWGVNFNTTAHGIRNPYYQAGIEVKGDNQYFVETIASALQSSGCPSVKTQIGATEIKPGHPKYDHARNTVYITIGYEE